MDRFAFIRGNNDILRENLNNTFDHIVDLLEISKEVDPLALPSFYKTIIIYTAAIIEALLFYICENQKNISLETEDAYWSYLEVKVYCKLEDNIEIVVAKRSKKTVKINNKTTFGKIVEFCRKNEIVGGDLCAELEKIYKLRRNIHLSSLEEVDHAYNKATMEHGFRVAEKVLVLAEKVS